MWNHLDDDEYAKLRKIVVCTITIITATIRNQELQPTSPPSLTFGLQYSQGNSFMLVYSITDPPSLEALKMYHGYVVDVKGNQPVCVVVGTKADDDDATKTRVTLKQAKAFVRAQGWDYPVLEVR